MKLIDRIILTPLMFLGSYMILCRNIQSRFLALLLSILICASLFLAIRRIAGSDHAKARKARTESIIRARRYVRDLAFKDPEESASILTPMLCAEFDLQVISADSAGFLAQSLSNCSVISISFVLRHPASGPLTAQDLVCALRRQRHNNAELCALVSLCQGGTDYIDEEFRSVRIVHGDMLADIFAKRPDLLPEYTKIEQRHAEKWRELGRSLLRPISRRRALSHIVYAALLLPGWLLSQSVVLLVCICFHLLIALRSFLPGDRGQKVSLL